MRYPQKRTNSSFRTNLTPVMKGNLNDKCVAKNIVMKTFWMIALLMSALSINIFGQKTRSTPEWEIRFGRFWGRVHENIVSQTINSDGRTTYLNKKNGTPVVGHISKRDVDEITGLINRLNLLETESIPSKEFNKCVVSPHLPNTYFSLIQNNKEHSLSHCNNSGDKKYEYTLNLNVKQRATYKRLREKLESLFLGDIRKQADNSSKANRVEQQL